MAAIFFFTQSSIFGKMVQSLYLNLVLVLCVTFSKDALSKHLGRSAKSSDDGKIVGGYNTTIQNVPYQAYLLLQSGNTYYQCGGSIINRRTILTAAHCLTNIQTAYVRIGSTESNSGGKQYTSMDLRQHPLYNATSSDYDVGIIKLVTPMTLDGTNAKAVKLPSSGSAVPAGTNVLVTGWGTTTENGDTSTNLMAVTVPVVSNEQCRQSYSYISARMFCAGVPEGGKDSCQGDSGGPAVTEKDGVQRGIVSFGIGCARAGIPGVYTRVSDRSIRNFIRVNSP